MALIRIIEAQVSSSTVPQPLLIIGGGVVAFLLTYLLTFGVIKFCAKFNLLDRPNRDQRDRIHKKPVPRLGGVAIFLGFIFASLLFYVTNPEVQGDEMIRYILLMIAALLLVVTHAYDDVRGLSAPIKFAIQTVAVIIILGPWNWHFYGIILFGFSNPFGVTHGTNLPWYQQTIISVFIHTPDITWLAIPAVLITWFWFVGMTNTINFIDGLDGLASGVVAITGIFITIVCVIQKQYTIATLAGIFSGAVLGFMPHNWSPAKIFMGDSGSQFLGLMLAGFSIMGGAKVALALMVLGIPILDVAVIIVRRLRRGQSFAQADTTSHLHYRLLATGLTARQICYIFYGLTTAFGLLALSLPRNVKIIGLILVGATMFFLIFWLDNLQKQREMLLQATPSPAREPHSSGEDHHTPAHAEG
ncbi:glycosyltransferase family 4 protein [Ktedonospora formicarum]|uniref:Undecaprenyl-phosphate alpha-N-acetylglucosaminyl 1-phosphate transferase n=1 Tax=Ktedonospora formicarum TaxID=2778364 RepID=A0A8J3I2B4_9CHLR|nr:MraY family glycosyltransferase [Ktedonospora formicarum]GHO44947.1 undecaprenyl-phosphate alpha-N-acetylglucosaminyl 1-phosphate transferase [Ktedonospora formicarum]